MLLLMRMMPYKVSMTVIEMVCRWGGPSFHYVSRAPQELVVRRRARMVVQSGGVRTCPIVQLEFGRRVCVVPSTRGGPGFAWEWWFVDEETFRRGV